MWIEWFTAKPHSFDDHQINRTNFIITIGYFINRIDVGQIANHWIVNVRFGMTLRVTCSIQWCLLENLSKNKVNFWHFIQQKSLIILKLWYRNASDVEIDGRKNKPSKTKSSNRHSCISESTPKIQKEITQLCGCRLQEKVRQNELNEKKNKTRQHSQHQITNKPERNNNEAIYKILLWWFTFKQL